MDIEDDILYCKTFTYTSDNPLWSKYVNFFDDYDVGTLSETEYLY